MIKKTVLITGGGGFVGRHLIDELNREWTGARIVVWDRPDVDITEPGSYLESLKETQPEWVVHLAAFASVGDSYEQEDLVYKVNVEATQRLLEAIEKYSPDTKVLAVSSADIYGLAVRAHSGEPLPELALSQAKPSNPYAQSKLDMEKMIEDRFNDRVVRVRPFPHIGPGQREGFVTADFASQIVAIEKKKQDPVIKVGNLVAKRDFTDVRDVARAYRLLMEKGASGEVYHVASGQAVGIEEVLEKLLALSPAKIRIFQDPEKMRPSDVPVLCGSAEKLYELTGWEATTPLSRSLEDILNWWREGTRLP
jgi:GDP-4-dehydro-6-deoxy-D-mannose reductase